MTAPCDHYQHDDAETPAVWRATAASGVVIADLCTEHLGDGLDDFDGHVNLDRIDQL